MLRLFLSHKAESKRKATEIKDAFLFYGVSCFVAHEDIEPTKEWQAEIERALATMHVMVPLMTESFHESNWTDQEVGIAIGRGVPIVAVMLGRDPYGFIGKYQGVQGSGTEPRELAKELLRLFFSNDAISPMATDGIITATERADNYDHANKLAEFLPNIRALSLQQADRLVRAFNNNAQVRPSHGFTGKHPRMYGEGLKYHLKRLTGVDYSLDEVHNAKAGDSPVELGPGDIPF